MSGTGARTVITGGTIHAADGVLRDHAVVLNGAHIEDIVRADAAPPGVPSLDIAGGTLAAGFIDLQVNGGGGVQFNDAPRVDAIARIGAAHRRFGTTGFLPTFISGPGEAMAEAIDAVRAALEAEVPGVLGIHLEGPHISVAKRGVHDAAEIRRLEVGDLDLLASLGRGRTLVTLAPESADDASIRALAERGVVVALGHTEADYATMSRAFAAGARAATHLFNGMGALGSREPGAVGAALAHDDVWCGVIADGHHVHWQSLRIACRAKPPGKVFLVTDAMAPSGAAPPMAGFRLGGQEIRVAEGRLVDGEGRLAGALLTMDQAVRNAVTHLGLPLEEALRMASAYPADLIGADRTLGRIVPGLRASLVWLDQALQVRATWIDGVRSQGEQ